MEGGKSRFSPFLKQCFVTTAVGMNLVGHGAVMGFSSVLLPQLHEPDSGIQTSTEADSWIASSVGTTLLIGVFMTTPIMSHYGRKMAHYAVSASALLGWLITLFATCVWVNKPTFLKRRNIDNFIRHKSLIAVILVGRIISGLSFGMMLPLRSILIGEYTSPRNRGAFLTTIALTQGVGIFFVHLVGSLLNWRLTIIACLFLHFISLVMTVFTPESPSWLAAKGKYDECRKVFHWLRGDEEERELKAMIKAKMKFDETHKKLKLMEIMHNKAFYKPIILMFHTYALGPLSGAVSIAAYATTLIELIMNPEVNVDAWMLGFDTHRIVMNTVAILIIHQFRRRTVMFAIGGLSVAVHLAIAAYVYLKNQGILNQEALWIPGILLNTQVFTISVGMVPLPNIIAGEVFPLEYRSLAGSISLTGVASTLFVVLKTFPGLVAIVGISGSYCVYATLLTYCLIVIWFIMPETKDRTLQEIEDEYTGKSSG